jgi:GT2 family glycosyltransferase
LLKKVVQTLSVAMPIGAWHPFLPAALASLSEQGVALELAYLDASGDERVTQALSESGIEASYHRRGGDEGQSAAIAEGWAKTNGDVVFWLNADDRLTPHALQRVMAEFNEYPECAVVFGGSDFLDANGAVSGEHDQIEDVSEKLYRSNIISQPSCFVRRSWIDRVGSIDVRLKYTMDWDLWIRLYVAGANFRRVDAKLSQVFMGAGTKTSQVNFRRLSEIAKLVSRYAGSWNALKSTFAVATHQLRN